MTKPTDANVPGNVLDWACAHNTLLCTLGGGTAKHSLMRHAVGHLIGFSSCTPLRSGLVVDHDLAATRTRADQATLEFKFDGDSSSVPVVVRREGSTPSFRT